LPGSVPVKLVPEGKGGLEWEEYKVELAVPDRGRSDLFLDVLLLLLIRFQCSYHAPVTVNDDFKIRSGMRFSI
jgi:hypothetical protein